MNAIIAVAGAGQDIGRPSRSAGCLDGGDPAAWYIAVGNVAVGNVAVNACADGELAPGAGRA